MLLPFLCAQNDLQANVNLQFRFANPGARAQAMGGAFIGLADDTTAIFANPAGLVQLGSTTLVLESNSTRNDNDIPFYSGRITQTDLQDFSFDLNSREFPETIGSIPFLGYVNPKGKAKWGLFYAEQANFERRFTTEGLGIPAFSGGRFISENRFEVFSPSENFIEMTLRSLGGSVAGKLSNRISAGITISFDEFDYAGNSTLTVPDPRLIFPEINFSPRDIEALEPFFGQSFAVIDVGGEDRQVSFNAGLLYTATERFSVGVSYKQQASFDYDYVGRGRNADFELVEDVSGVAEFNVPDSFGLGLSFKPTDVMIFSMDLNRIFYSQLSDDFLRLFQNSNDPINATQTVADTTEYHLGFEYIFTTTRNPISLRLGYWNEPYHALINSVLDTQLIFRYLSTTGDYLQGARPTVFLHRFEEDLNHVTFGLGITVGGNFTLDLSGDLDDQKQSFSLSSIYRF